MDIKNKLKQIRQGLRHTISMQPQYVTVLLKFS